MERNPGDVFCSEAARAERAPLAGTATRADAWLLVEHYGAWGARAVEQNDLPAAVQEWMQAQAAALKPVVGKVRPLLVRRDEGRSRTTFACFLAIAREDRRELYRLDVQGHLDLAGLDLAALLAGGELEDARQDHGLLLVCGNGRRDRCCARLGVATWRALAVEVGEEAWLSTHQGGHRYAAAGLSLPEGIAYGYLTTAEIEPLLAARGRGEIHLPCFRGRTFHDAPVQAADAMLRAGRHEAALDPWRLAEAVEATPGEWRVTFAAPTARHAVRLRRESEEALVSCSPAKRKTIDRFTLIDIDSENTA
ncbi:MAG TPA: sucrase ferredoxin [Thermoanaerobaculia bacterium]|nr:sucrase ferredoxin [Thermoanaerobaculia bacterium]